MLAGGSVSRKADKDRGCGKERDIHIGSCRMRGRSQERGRRASRERGRQVPTPSGRRALMCSEQEGNQDGQNSGKLTKAAGDEAEERGFEG